MGIEARGFILAARPPTARASAWCRSARPAAFPGETLGQAYALEYGTAEIEVHTDAGARRPGARPRRRARHRRHRRGVAQLVRRAGARSPVSRWCWSWASSEGRSRLVSALDSAPLEGPDHGLKPESADTAARRAGEPAQRNRSPPSGILPELVPERQAEWAGSIPLAPRPLGVRTA